ncbi:MAG: RNA polymerase sigma factor RpoD, partial [Pseudomonadota bacterium]
MDQQQQQSQLKLLIAKGKEQGYLTYAQVNDHLPNDIVDPEQIEDIISMINDMGIAVHEAAPESDSLLMNDNSVDEVAAEEAAAALATVDSEFGRTTDPVRMYMREMGAVELLTREGEIEIAKRIEDGLNQALNALSSSPGTIGSVLELYARIDAGEARMSKLLTGFIDPNADDVIATPVHITDEDNNTPSTDADNDDEEQVDTGPNPDEVRAHMKQLRKHYDKTITGLAKGKHTPALKKTRQTMSDLFLEIKLVPVFVDNVTRNLRSLIERIRRLEREILTICVKECDMPRKTFIKTFPQNETNTEWLDQHLKSKEPYAKALRGFADEIRRNQAPLILIEQDTGLSINEIKDINRRMSIGEAKARRAKKEMVEGNLRLVISIAKKYTNRG